MLFLHTISKYSIKKVVLGILVFLFVLGITPIANASLSVYYTSADGKQWANPFSLDLLNKTFNDQQSFMTGGFQFALLEEVEASAASDGYATSSAGITAWLTDRFFGGINPSSNGGPCGALSSCDIRLADVRSGARHFGLVSGASVYNISNFNDSYTGTNSIYLGALAYGMNIPEPGVLGLFGFNALVFGYMAYQRNRTLN
ncbi:MAG: hypothetical protein KBE16_04385 [Alphaproteobacteria bacterium]|nr:hypothetical protein [Alphaproteobacteria bacterium]MBP9877622.1 hypothetical protein [Alphaproteobacteria bacterium]